MEFKKFSGLSVEQLNTMAEKHFEFFSRHNSNLTLDSVDDTFKNVYAADDNLPYGIAILSDNTVIGFCNLRLNALWNYECVGPYICGLYIFKEFRHLGYGTKLIDYAKAELKKLGYKKAYLWTEEIPEFYEKLGFCYVKDILKNDKTGYARLYIIDI